MPHRTIQVNSSGNITLLVLDLVEPARRTAVAARLMQRDCAIEQVGFVLPPLFGSDGRLEMMGGEFCGNATRALGFYLASQAHSDGCHQLHIESSGATEPVRIIADLDAKTAVAEMPLPRSIEPFLVDGIAGTLVHFDGISHLLLSQQFEEDLLQRAKRWLAGCESDAFGVLFFDSATLSLTPVVTVRSTKTTIFEGSCGTGSAAAGCVLALQRGDGEYHFSLQQPAGTIETVVMVQAGQVVRAAIGGSVILGKKKKPPRG